MSMVLAITGVETHWRSALSVFVSVEGRTIGALLLGDELRRETQHAVRTLRKAGVSRIW